MSTLKALIKRDMKMFFKDKGLFFTSLITPLILLVLYISFLSNVYHDSFLSAMPAGVEIQEKIVDAFVGGQLFSSLLAVCCVTVAFCSNMLMVQDKVTGSRNDLTISPVRHSTLALGYYISTFLSTMTVCLVATGACFIYIAGLGWMLSFSDVALILLDVFLLVMFGTTLSSIVNFFLSSQGQISAVGSIVSSVYGFVCGAYMPISQFSEGLQKVISFLPGTYGTSLLRNHALRGVFSEMEATNVPHEVTESIRDAFDCNLYFFGDKVEIGTMYIILSLSAFSLVCIYVLMNRPRAKRS